MLENPKVPKGSYRATPRCTLSVKYCAFVPTTKKEVKMAGYWCRSFLCFYGPRRRQDQYPVKPWWN